MKAWRLKYCQYHYLLNWHTGCFTNKLLTPRFIAYFIAIRFSIFHDFNFAHSAININTNGILDMLVLSYQFVDDEKLPFGVREIRFALKDSCTDERFSMVARTASVNCIVTGVNFTSPNINFCACSTPK